MTSHISVTAKVPPTTTTPTLPSTRCRFRLTICAQAFDTTAASSVTPSPPPLSHTPPVFLSLADECLFDSVVQFLTVWCGNKPLNSSTAQSDYLNCTAKTGDPFSVVNNTTRSKQDGFTSRKYNNKVSKVVNVIWDDLIVQAAWLPLHKDGLFRLQHGLAKIKLVTTPNFK